MRPLIDVVPKYVNEAKPGKKYGSIKLADDTKYLVPAKMVSQLSPNTPAKVEIHTETWSDGPVEIINRIVGVTNGAALPPKQNVRQRMDPADAMGAFVTVTFGNYVHAGKVSLNRDAIKLALGEIEAGYRMHHRPQRADDLNDEIPEGEWAVNSENPAD